ncbi:MAG: hypothetical protein ACOYMG_29270, partial [Candidatus Methylumidiphilus sp.]
MSQAKQGRAGQGAERCETGGLEFNKTGRWPGRGADRAGPAPRFRGFAMFPVVGRNKVVQRPFPAFGPSIR